VRSSPSTIAREIDAQNKRLSRFLPLKGARTIDLRIVNHDCATLLPYRQGPSPDLQRLTIYLVKSGQFLDAKRMAKAPHFELPRVDGVAPTMDAQDDFPEVDAIFAAREAATQALPDTPAPVGDAAAPRPEATTGPTDEQAIASIEAYRERVRVRLLDKAKALGRHR
jgi:hypothetical protein